MAAARYPKRTVNKRSKTRPSKTRQSLKTFLWVAVAVLFIGLLGYHYRIGLAYYLGFKSDKIRKTAVFSTVRNLRILEKHEGKSFGIDVSAYQGSINWEEVKQIEDQYPIDYVFVRATAGNNKVDPQFQRNWKGAQHNGLLRGAYHYYRPNENSLEQAQLFIQTVKLEKGDLPPILDIEKLPKNQSMANLKKGLRKWLMAVEAHYQVRPIIYSGEKYYTDFLKEAFSDYPFWIANYNFYRETIAEDWLFWQFTENARVSGIDGPVDVNIYNGDLQQLEFITVSEEGVSE